MRRDSSEERREQDDAAHDLDVACTRSAWWCNVCQQRVYGLGEHFGPNGICKTSAPAVDTAPPAQVGAVLGERGSLGDPPSPLGEPDVSRNGASGSVPLTEGGEQ